MGDRVGFVGKPKGGLGPPMFQKTSKESRMGDKKKPQKQKKKSKKEPEVLVVGKGGKAKKKK